MSYLLHNRHPKHRDVGLVSELEVVGARKRSPGFTAYEQPEALLEPRGADRNYAARLEKCLGPRAARGGHGRFGVSAAQRARRQFAVSHYAGPVVYDTDGFLEKNKDALPAEAEAVFRASERELVQTLFPSCAAEDGGGDGGAAAARGRGASGAKPTVGTQFKKQLQSLRAKISAIHPHYVRCLKPNDLNAPAAFARARVAEQLRCGGVLEAVRVARTRRARSGRWA